MSKQTESPVVWVGDDDAAMDQAMTRARSTFKYLWRELTWEYRRIVPALELSAVKAAFRDPGDESGQVEHMWLSEIRFNGEVIVANLLNSPNWLRSVEEGDEITLRQGQIEDWMYVLQGRVYGGFTIQCMRATMSKPERASHDEAWGFTFPDPKQVELVPDWDSGSKPDFWARLLGAKATLTDPDQEHPMSEAMAGTFAEAIDGDPDGFLESRDEDGLNSLHSLALGGSAACVRVLLDKGADPALRTKAGHTAAYLAEQMGWSRVVEILRQATS